MKTVKNAIFPRKFFFPCRGFACVCTSSVKKQKRGRSENPSEAVPFLFEKSN